MCDFLRRRSPAQPQAPDQGSLPGGIGFLICQRDEDWVVLVGGVGVTALAKVQLDTWTHLVVVQEVGRAAAYVNGVKAADLPHLGNAAPNFALGATAPGKEAFQGWVAEARVATFAPGKFDPAADFLLDTTQLRQAKAEAEAGRAQLIVSLTKPRAGVIVMATLDEPAAATDWLIMPPTNKVTLQVQPAVDQQTAQFRLANGLVSRTFLVSANLACIGLRRSDKDAEFVRVVKPEVRFKVNGNGWVEVGGMTGAPEQAYLVEDWIRKLDTKPDPFHFTGFTTSQPVTPYPWQPKFSAPPMPWPPKG
jgi:hypothetical protein